MFVVFVEKIAVLRVNLMLLLALGFAAWSLLSQAGEVAPNLSNYAECIIGSIQPTTPADQVGAIENDCYRHYPTRPRVGLLGWADVGICYDSHVAKAGNHLASLAIFNACERYFL